MMSRERETYVVSLENHTFEQFSDLIASQPIEGVVLHCVDNRRIDLGCLCYAIRDEIKKIPKPVQSSSLRHERCEPLRSWCVESISRFYLGASPHSIYVSAFELVTFVNWCDSNYYIDFLQDADTYKRAIDAYTQHLTAAMGKDGGIAVFTANRLQSQAVHSGSLFFPATSVNFLSDLPIISNKGFCSEPTVTPSQQDMVNHLTPCQYLFDGLTDFVLKGLPFPHRISYMETEALILPAAYAITTPDIVQSRPKVNNGTIWDYRLGEVSSLANASAKSISPSRPLIWHLNKAHKLLEQSNADLRHPKRLWIAKIAHDAFISLFVANAGLNEAQLRNMGWSENYETSTSESVGFVVIKYRAGEMEQNFEIKKTFLKQFKKFLMLRRFLCGDGRSDYLFINYTKNKLYNKPIRPNAISHFNDQMTRFLDPKYVGLTYKDLRKYKSVYLLSKNFTVGVVAAVMQNSGDTVLKHYAQAEEKQAIDEISTTLNFVLSILEQRLKVETPSGGCSGEQPSNAEDPPDQYEPNCRNFVGCIFCNEFRLHADEVSVHKMLSMRYVTAERLSSCTDLDQFQALHGKAIERIDLIMADLIELRPEMTAVVERIRSEVEGEFKLSPYWETLYGRLLKLKVIR